MVMYVCKRSDWKIFCRKKD